MPTVMPSEGLSGRRSVGPGKGIEEDANTVPVSSLSHPPRTLSILVRQGDDSLNVEGQIGGKSCLMTTDTGASVVIARPDITVGVPKRELTWPYFLQLALGETFTVMKEALVYPGAVRWMIWVRVTKIIDKFILELDVLSTHGASVDLAHHVLWLDGEEVILSCHGI
jgi:hypothetical protein